MVFCKQCGAKCNDDDLFCTACGERINRDEEVGTEGVNAEIAGEAESADSGKGFAIASMVLGIVSLCSCKIICGILAIIFGCVAKSKGSKSGMVTAGLITGIIGIILSIALWLLLILLPGILAGISMVVDIPSCYF